MIQIRSRVALCLLVLIGIIFAMATAQGPPTKPRIDAKTAETYYSILGVPLDASAAEIKKVYRTLARTAHPDKAKTAEEKETKHKEFVKIGNAYQVRTPSRSLSLSFLALSTMMPSLHFTDNI